MEWNHLVLNKGYTPQTSQTKRIRGDPPSGGLPTTYREVALRGCHDKVGHLGLECMLDLMCDRFFWPCMAAQAKEHVGRCHLCLAFEVKQ